MHQFKSYLREIFSKHFESIEIMFPEDDPVHNLAEASWIITHVESTSIEKPKKIKLFLKLCFAHWLNTVSESNVQNLHR